MEYFGKVNILLVFIQSTIQAGMGRKPLLVITPLQNNSDLIKQKSIALPQKLQKHKSLSMTKLEFRAEPSLATVGTYQVYAHSLILEHLPLLSKGAVVIST